MSDTEVTGKISETTAELALSAAAHAIVDAAMGTANRTICLGDPEKGDSFFIAILEPAEMELVLESREKEEG